MTAVRALSHRRNLLAIAAATALAAAGLTVPAGPGAGPADLAAATHQEPLPYTFHWAAPADATGTFAATVIVDPDGDAACVQNISATGTFNASNPVAYWEAGTSGVYAGHWRHPVHAHTGPADTRPLTAAREGSWHKVAGREGSIVPDGTTFAVTVAAFDLLHRSDSVYPRPLTIDLACNAPFDVELQAGRHARSFTPESFEGGVGASDAILFDGRIVARGDHLVETFDAPIVRFQATQIVAGLSSDRDGTMVLNYPGGTETWTWNPGGPQDINVKGGPGRYDVSLDWDGTWNDALYGVIVGIRPVDSLDEVFD